MEFVVVFAKESVKLWEGTMQFIQGLVPPVEVIATVVIALFTVALFGLQFLQHRHDKKVSRANYALALYEKRLEVYFEIERFLGAFLHEANAPVEAAIDLRLKCRNARFLFSDKPLAFIDELFKKSFALTRAEEKWEPLRARAFGGEKLLPDENLELEDALNERREIRDWFNEQILQGRLAAEFDPYLKLPESL